MKKAILNPQISIGDIRFNDHIENYADRRHEYNDKAGTYSYSYYSFADTPIGAYVTNEGEIESLRCAKECIWNGVNLIGLDYSEFTNLYPKEPDGIDQLWVMKGKEEQLQDEYDYDELGIAGVGFNNKIVTIMASAC